MANYFITVARIDDLGFVDGFYRNANCFFQAFQALEGYNVNPIFMSGDVRNSETVRIYRNEFRGVVREYVVKLDRP